MASYKKISEDVIRQVITVEEKEALQKYHKISKEVKGVEQEVARLRRQQDGMRKDSSAWKAKEEEIKKLNTQLKKSRAELKNLRDGFSVNIMTMAQLKKTSRELTRELDNMSAAASPEEYAQLSQRLAEVKNRMKDLNQQAKFLKEDTVESQKTGFLWGTAIVRIYDTIKGKMQEVISTSLELAESADGVAHAFSDIGQHAAILDSLRKATKGTVNDFELMKAAVQAKDFRIPLEDLGKYLSFAQLKAQQTGQSVEYMTNSIVTGLGRKSKMILDNLGISAAEIDEKIAETGDFMKAVAAIVDNQIAAAGETYISAADRALKKTTDLQNAQLRLGQALLPWKEAATDTFGTFNIGILRAITYLLTHRKALLAVTVVVTGFSVAMVALNTQIRTYIAQTRLAQAATLAWQTAATTFRGIGLLLSAAIATLSGNTTRASAAMRIFNATCKANVYMAVATAVIAAATALYAWITRNKQARAAVIDFMAVHKKLSEDIQAQNNSIRKSVNDTTAEQITKIKSLRKTVNDANASLAKRKTAVQELQRLVPGYHASIDGEGKLFAQNTKILDQYIDKLKQAALAEVAYERIKENQRKIMDAQDNIDLQKQNISNIKANALRKTGFDMERNNVDEVAKGHTSDKSLVSTVDQNYAYLKAQQQGLDRRAQIIQKEQAVVDAYSAQNDKLWKIVKESKATPPSETRSPETPNPSKNRNPGIPESRNTAARQRAAFDNERREQLDQQQRLYAQAMELLRQNLAQRTLTQDQYNQQALALEQAHTAKVYDIEQQFTLKAQQLQIQDADTKQRVVLAQQANEEKARRDFRQKNLEAMRRFYDAQQKIADTAMTDSERAERDHQLQLDALKAYYDAALDYARAHGQDTLALEQAYAKAVSRLRLDYERQTEQQRLQVRQQYGLVKAQEQYDLELEQLRRHLEEKRLTQEEYDKAVSDMDLRREENAFSIRQQYGLVSQQELYERQKQQLVLQYEEGLVSKEDFEAAKVQIATDYYKQEFDRYASLVSGAISALQEAEMANIDAKYDAEIEAARQAGQDTTEIENRKANEKLKVQKKYADIDFAIKASQIIADTSVAIMKALADLGPIGGPIAAALMGVTGAAQLAAANAERQKVKKMSLAGSADAAAAAVTGERVATGLEQGGPVDVTRAQDRRRFRAQYEPDRRGYVSRPTVIVGEGPAGKSKEWVASNATLQNPTVAPLIDIIDRAQQAGTIRTLDLRRVLLRQVPAYAAGGYLTPTAITPTTPTPPTTPITPQPPSTPPDEVSRQLLALLRSLRSDGIPAVVALSELEARQRLRDRARDIARKT